MFVCLNSNQSRLARDRATRLSYQTSTLGVFRDEKFAATVTSVLARGCALHRDEGATTDFS